MYEYEVLSQRGEKIICLSPPHSVVFETNHTMWRDYLESSLHSPLGKLLYALDLHKMPDLEPDIPGAMDFTNLILNLTNKCNYRCSYCFQEDNNSKVMSKAVYENAIGLIPKYFNPERCNITFFGGEPLLLFRRIMEMTAYAKQKLKGRHLSFSMTTNGSLLDTQKIGFLVENDFNLIVSLDSFEKTDSLTRKPKHGDPHLVYRSITNNIKTLVQQGANLSCNVVITEQNTSSLSNFVIFLHSLGVRNITMSLVSSGAHCLSPSILEDLLDQMEQIIDILIENPELNVDPISGLMKSISSHKLHLYNCGYGRLRVNVQPNGDITPCQRVSNVIGNVNDGIDLAFSHNTACDYVDNRSICNQCSFRYLCGGNCYHESDVYEGDPQKPYIRYCEFFGDLVKIISEKMIDKYKPIVEIEGFKLL